MPSTTVMCVVCGWVQDDRGKRQTCAHCGTSPMPSYSYAPDCVFHPTRQIQRDPNVSVRLTRLRHRLGAY